MIHANYITTPTATAPPPPIAPYSAANDSYIQGISAGTMAVNTYAARAEGFPEQAALKIASIADHLTHCVFILDDSSSMNTKDGTIKITQPDSETKVHFVKSSRWSELTQTVSRYVRYAEVLGFKDKLQFCLLNTFQGQLLSADQTLDALQNINTPSGRTPLVGAVSNIRDQLIQSHPSPNVLVTIFTDGEPDGGDLGRNQFTHAIKSLFDMPNARTMVMIRLMTDQPSVINYYNDLDQEVGEQNIDVMDDLENEQIEIKDAGNPFIRQTEIFEFMRLFLCDNPNFDNVDEEKLSPVSIYEIAQLLYGSDVNGRAITHPDINFKQFVEDVKVLVKRDPQSFDGLGNLSAILDPSKIKKPRMAHESCCVIS